MVCYVIPEMARRLDPRMLVNQSLAVWKTPNPTMYALIRSPEASMMKTPLSLPESHGPIPIS